MSKVKIQGHASGTGVLTVTAPNTSTDRTITLPDSTGELLSTAGGTMTGKIVVDQNSNDKGVHITTDATTDSAIQVEADSLTTGRAAIFYSHSGNTGTRDLVKIHNDNAASTGTTAFNVTQDSTGLVADFAGTGGIRSAGGIKFGTDTAAANTLDDYEEGTWTPAWNSGSNGRTIANSGSYTKIGNRVHVSGLFQINGSNNTGSGDVSFSGLPFTSSSNQYGRAATSSIWFDLATTANIGGWVQDNSQLFYFRENGTLSDGADLGNHIDQDTFFFFAATYQSA